MLIIARGCKNTRMKHKVIFLYFLFKNKLIYGSFIMCFCRIIYNAILNIPHINIIHVKRLYSVIYRYIRSNNDKILH